MPDDTNPTPAPKKPSRPKNPIDLRSLDEIKKGEDVSEGANDPVWMAELADEGVAATAAGDLAQLCVDARKLGDKLITATQVKESATQEELKAFDLLMAALRVFQKPAKRKFAGDVANQKAYFIG